MYLAILLVAEELALAFAVEGTHRPARLPACLFTSLFAIVGGGAVVTLNITLPACLGRYGYLRDRFVFSLISAVGIFFLGGWGPSALRDLGRIGP